MSTFLQFLGVVFLLIVMMVFVVVLTVRSKVRHFLRSVEGLQPTISTPPARIHLTRLDEANWDDEEAIQSQVEPLPGLGFTDLGVFQVDEIDGLKIQALVNTGQGVAAAVYEHPSAGVWLDLFTHFQDGTRITFANTSQGSGVDHAPGHEVTRVPGLDAKSLFHQFLHERPGRPIKPIDASNFIAIYERAYADEMDWRNTRGGPTESEIRAVAAVSGEEYDDSVVDATRQALFRQAHDRLDETLRQNFLTATSMSAGDWEKVRERLLIVHDLLTPELFAEDVAEWIDEDFCVPVSPSPSYSIRRAFTTFNERLPEFQKFRKLGEVKEPVEADFYQAPAS